MNFTELLGKKVKLTLVFGTEVRFYNGVILSEDTNSIVFHDIFDKTITINKEAIQLVQVEGVDYGRGKSL